METLQYLSLQISRTSFHFKGLSRTGKCQIKIILFSIFQDFEDPYEPCLSFQRVTKTCHEPNM